MKEKETRGCYNCGAHSEEKGCAKNAFRECQSKGNGEFWEPKES